MQMLCRMKLHQFWNLEVSWKVAAIFVLFPFPFFPYHGWIFVRYSKNLRCCFMHHNLRVLLYSSSLLHFYYHDLKFESNIIKILELFISAILLDSLVLKFEIMRVVASLRVQSICILKEWLYLYTQRSICYIVFIYIITSNTCPSLFWKIDQNIFKVWFGFVYKMVPSSILPSPFTLLYLCCDDIFSALNFTREP